MRNLIKNYNFRKFEQVGTKQVENSHQTCDSGSLTVFIMALFTLTMVFSFESIDIANSYLAKRHLIQIGESAIQRGAHQIDKNRYFNSDLTIEPSANGVARFRVPLDCGAARIAFEQELDGERLGNQRVEILEWSCVNDVLNAKIRAKIHPPLVVPLISDLAGNDILVDAQISASSVITN